MPYNSAEKRRAYRARPETKKLEAASARRHYLKKRLPLMERRRALLAEFSCLACGESEPCCIDWHHVDDETKSFNIATGMLRGEETWWNEILKCVAICSNCHRKLHNNKLCLIPVPLPTKL